MLLPSEPFAISHRLRAAHATIRDEITALPDDLWIRWPNECDVSGDVRVVPLFLRYRPPTLPAVEDRARALCARTWQLLGRDAVSLVISRMEPGCHVRPHRDLDGPGHLRCHLGVAVPRGAWMAVDGTRTRWRDGECLVFDPRRVHEVRNDGAVSRTILIVDFVPTPAELDAAGCSSAPLS